MAFEEWRIQSQYGSGNQGDVDCLLEEPDVTQSNHVTPITLPRQPYQPGLIMLITSSTKHTISPPLYYLLKKHCIECFFFSVLHNLSPCPADFPSLPTMPFFKQIPRHILARHFACLFCTHHAWPWIFHLAPLKLSLL